MTVSDLRVLVNNLDEYIHIPGGIDRLRKTVIHLAVSGQLVPQDPTEGTGADLYEQILKEKSTRIAEGKIKNKKPSAELSGNDSLYDIPDTWAWARLSDITYLITDGTHHTPQYKPNGIPFLSIKDVSAGLLDFSDCKYISQKEYEEINKRCNPEAGDILFCRIGTLGRPVIVDTQEPFSIFVSLGLIKFNQELILPEFLRLYLDAPATYKEYRRIMAGGSHTNKLNLNTMNNLVTVLPPVAEQKRILERLKDILKCVDDLADKYSAEEVERAKFVKSSLRKLSYGGSHLALANIQMIKTKSDVSELRKAILVLAMSGKLAKRITNEGTGRELYQQIQAKKNSKEIKRKPVPEINADETPLQIPEHWVWVRFGNIGSIISGTSYSKGNLSDHGVRILRGGNVIDGSALELKADDVFVDSSLEDTVKKVRSGDVVIVASTGSLSAIGKPSLASEDMDAQIGAFLRILRADDGINASYFWLYLCSDLYRSRIRSLVKGTNINNIKNEYVTHGLFPLPPLEEQKRIVNTTTKLLGLVNELETNIQN